MPCWRPISQVRLRAEVGVEAAAAELGRLVGGRGERSARGGGCRGRRRSRSRSQTAGRRPRRRARAAIAAEPASSPRWRLEQVGWTATAPSLRSTLEPRQQPLARPRDRVEDRSASRGARAFTSLSSATAVLGEPVRARARVADDRQLAAIRSSARARRPSGSPSAGRRRDSPSSSTGSRSSGRRRRAGSRPAGPARAETATSASGRLSAVSAPLRARPKIRLMQAGR